MKICTDRRGLLLAEMKKSLRDLYISQQPFLFEDFPQPSIESILLYIIAFLSLSFCQKSGHFVFQALSVHSSIKSQVAALCITEEIAWKRSCWGIIPSSK